ncbi:MAG: hypothetical protein EBR82_69090 [Caulobacteraceae bacterium]|nr:hypothetical protein [Caulobacteraceae bacterium]
MKTFATFWPLNQPKKRREQRWLSMASLKKMFVVRQEKDLQIFSRLQEHCQQFQKFMRHLPLQN